MTADGDTINTVSYAERIERGKQAQVALGQFDDAFKSGDNKGKEEALQNLKKDYEFFGYGYFDSVDEAIPPVGVTFYTFRIMVILGSYFLLYLIIALFMVYRKQEALVKAKWLQWIALLSVPFMWICSQAGWAVAEVGRQPWTIQNLLPTKAAISNIPVSSVMTTFWLFAIIFTVLLAAEISIMLRFISNKSKQNLELDNHSK